MGRNFIFKFNNLINNFQKKKLLKISKKKKLYYKAILQMFLIFN
jgi:hypothetical protein